MVREDIQRGLHVSTFVDVEFTVKNSFDHIGQGKCCTWEAAFLMLKQVSQI